MITIEELTGHLARAYDELATINKYLAENVPAFLAMRLALEEVNPNNFEKVYAHYFREPGTKLIHEEREQQARAFSQMAESLRHSVQ